MGKRVLITGGTGFLGKHVALKLADLGYIVTITGRNEKKANNIIKESKKKIIFKKLDITNQKLTIETLNQEDYVIHCAGLASPWGPIEDFKAANTIGTQNIVNACLKNKIQRLINISTPSVYFDYQDKIGIKETDPLPKKQITFYSKTKLEADEIIKEAFLKSKLKAISLRPRAIFGKGDQNITPRLLRTKVLGKTPLINKGEAIHDFTYVDNVVDAIILCLDSDESTLGKIYNITNDEPLPLKEIHRKFLEAHGQKVNFININSKLIYYFVKFSCFVKELLNIKKEPKITNYSLGLLTYSQVLDISAAKKELGYSPKISIDSGLKKMTTEK